MSDLDAWVEKFLAKVCPSCGKPVARGKQHGARATCGDPVCIQRCRGNQGRCPVCGMVRGVGSEGRRLLTCGNPRCVKVAQARGTQKQVAEQMLKPNDPRSCRCGAKLSFLVDMYGQAHAVCDACHSRERIGPKRFSEAA